MGVRTLIGTADGTTHAAAMYESGSGWMIGPIFEAEDAEDQIEAFLDWLRRDGVAEYRRGTNDVIVHLYGDGSHPGSYHDSDLERLVKFWKLTYLGDDGLLRRTDNERTTA